MNFYKYQKSRLFTDLWPGCLIFNTFNFYSSKNAGLLEIKLHVEAPWDVRIQVCAWVLGHMAKIYTMPIYTYGKTLYKSSSQD